jgi:hypothetical protein
MSIPRSSDLDLLLSTAPLEGTHAAWREVGPELLTSLVDATSVADARMVIGEHCCFWGGGCSALIPVDPEAQTIAQPWLSLVQSNRLDHVAARDLVDENQELWSLDVRNLAPLTEPLFTILVGHPLREENRVRVSLPPDDDPWWVAYAGTLGVLPDMPPADLVQRSGLIPGLQWDQLANVEREQVDEPSAVDLIDRVRDREAVDARFLSLRKLGVRSARWSQDLVNAPTWVQKGWNALHVGSNIAVVYEPGSVHDLCLLWTLRSAHGLPDALPLAIPATADVVGELDSLTNLDDRGRFAPRLRGFERPWALVSTSVKEEQLTEIAQRAQGPWQPFPVGELLQPPHRPMRHSADIAHFVNGSAQVAVWDPTDREIVQQRPAHAFGLNLRGRIILSDKQLPSLRTLRGHAFTGGGWIGGGYDFQAHSASETVSVPWPSTWALLRATAADHGLRVRPSRPGQAAAALLDRMGSFAAVDALKDDRILAELDRLGEREGISWFRKRVRDIQASLAELDEGAAAQSARIDERLDALVVPPVDDAQHELTASTKDFHSIFGAKNARAWLAWAEAAGLLVRGVRIECDQCGTKAWRPAGELAPPIACPGCAQALSQPFPADVLTFRYRASRLLIEVQAADALPHVLCSAWWIALFRRSGMVGLYPGVEFLEGDSENVLAEVDVVILLLDGTVALGECKRRSGGLHQSDLDNLDKLAERIDAAWTFAATPGWAGDAPEIWRALRRDLPERRRFALCGEQLLTPSSEIMNLLGHDPTEWSPASSEAQQACRDAYREKIADIISWLERPQSLADWLIPS